MTMDELEALRQEAEMAENRAMQARRALTAAEETARERMGGKTEAGSRWHVGMRGRDYVIAHCVDYQTKAMTAEDLQKMQVALDRAMEECPSANALRVLSGMGEPWPFDDIPF